MKSTATNLRDLLNKNTEEKKSPIKKNNQKATMNLIDLSVNNLKNLNILDDKKEEKKINKEYLNKINSTFFSPNLNTEPTAFEKPEYTDTSKYTKNSVNLYSNLYPIEITKKYTIYSYRIEFIADSQNTNTFLKKKIISKSFIELNPYYNTYFFSGDAFYSTKKVDEVKNFEVNLFSTKHYFQIKPLKESFSITNNPKEFITNENKFILKNIFELMFKDILKGNPDLKMEKNLFIKDLDQRIIDNRYDDHSLVLKPGYSTKVVILENGIFLNVDNKNKIINCKDCFTLIKDKTKGGKTIKDNTKSLENYFKGRLVETKHTHQKMKIDSISFDKNPKNTTLNYEGKSLY